MAIIADMAARPLALQLPLALGVSPFLITKIIIFRFQIIIYYSTPYDGSVPQLSRELQPYDSGRLIFPCLDKLPEAVHD